MATPAPISSTKIPAPTPPQKPIATHQGKGKPQTSVFTDFASI